MSLQASHRPVFEQRRALRDLVLADKVDEAAIRDASAKLAEAVAEAAIARAKLVQDLKTHLSDEQITQVRAFIDGSPEVTDNFLNELEG